MLAVMEVMQRRRAHLFSIHGCRCDNELEVSSAGEDCVVSSRSCLGYTSSVCKLTLSEQTHQDIGTQRPLMRFVQDQYRVSVQIAFVQRLSQ